MKTRSSPILWAVFLVAVAALLILAVGSIRALHDRPDLTEHLVKIDGYVQQEPEPGKRGVHFRKGNTEIVIGALEFPSVEEAKMLIAEFKLMTDDSFSIGLIPVEQVISDVGDESSVISITLMGVQTYIGVIRNHTIVYTIAVTSDGTDTVDEDKLEEYAHLLVTEGVEWTHKTTFAQIRSELAETSAPSQLGTEGTLDTDSVQVEPNFSSVRDDIVVLSHSVQPTSLDQDVVVGEVINNGAQTYDFVNVGVTFYDTAGVVVDTQMTYTNPKLLRPGEKGSFKVWVSRNRKWSTYRVAVLD